MQHGKSKNHFHKANVTFWNAPVDILERPVDCHIPKKVN